METIAAANQRVYERRSTAACWDTELVTPERDIFRNHAANIDGRLVLDIGVGTGRTTAYLAPRAAQYIGLDYSNRMVSLCRKRFPSLDIRKADARDLSQFSQENFDFVLFSFNGIDTVEHEDRMRILRQMHFVLKTGGVLAFSSHDLTCAGSLSRQLYQTRLTSQPYLLLNPLSVLRSAYRLSRRMYNRARNARKEVRSVGHAMLNDRAMEFACLHYYVSEDEQEKQLREVGFDGPVEVYRNQGDNPDSLYYVTRKGPSQVAGRTSLRN